MPSVLTVAANTLVATHPFFTTFMGSAVTVAAKRLLARKLLFYEVRGRPVDTRGPDIVRFDGECTLWDPRPQFGTAQTQVSAALTRIASAPYVPGEAILTDAAAFPAIYWGARFASGTQRPWVRDTIRRYHGFPSGVAVSPADRTTYSALLTASNDGYANTDRARLIMKYNAPDLPSALPGTGLVLPPLF